MQETTRKIMNEASDMIVRNTEVMYDKMVDRMELVQEFLETVIGRTRREKHDYLCIVKGHMDNMQMLVGATLAPTQEPQTSSCPPPTGTTTVQSKQEFYPNGAPVLPPNTNTREPGRMVTMPDGSLTWAKPDSPSTVEVLLDDGTVDKSNVNSDGWSLIQAELREKNATAKTEEQTKPEPKPEPAKTKPTRSQRAVKKLRNAKAQK